MLKAVQGGAAPPSKSARGQLYQGHARKKLDQKSEECTGMSRRTVFCKPPEKGTLETKTARGDHRESLAAGPNSRNRNRRVEYEIRKKTALGERDTGGCL